MIDIIHRTDNGYDITDMDLEVLCTCIYFQTYVDFMFYLLFCHLSTWNNLAKQSLLHAMYRVEKFTSSFVYELSKKYIFSYSAFGRSIRLLMNGSSKTVRVFADRLKKSSF